jgi:hypothetical protein
LYCCLGCHDTAIYDNIATYCYGDFITDKKQNKTDKKQNKKNKKPKKPAKE